MKPGADIPRHLRRMRATCVVGLVVVAVVAGLAFALPHRGPALASPGTITVVALAASLWIGFTANRDARNRLEKIRSSFASHGSEARLLRDHWIVFAAVLLRLQIMTACGLVVSLWGVGPRIGVWIILLGGLLIGLTWPTTRKTQLLLGRARALREIE